MAKKVRKDGERKEEKKVVFEPPEFDEREYLTEQLENIKNTLFFIILAIPMGTAWAYTAIATDSNTLGLIVALAGYFAGVQVLKFVFSRDILEMPKKVLATTFLMFLFTSLALSVLMANPPANDVTPPSITDVMVVVNENGTEEGVWYVLMRHRDNLALNKSNEDRKDDHPDQRLFFIEEGTSAKEHDNISFLVRAADASGLRGVWVEYGYINMGPLQDMYRIDEARWIELERDRDYYLWGEHYFEYRIDDVSAGSLYFKVTVEDMNGHTQIFETRLSDEAIWITS
jgi:hypothetical protein